MFYLILNNKNDIGISVTPHPVSMDSCSYVWHNAQLDTDETSHFIKNSQGIIVAIFPKETTATFSDVKELGENGLDGETTLRS